MVEPKLYETDHCIVLDVGEHFVFRIHPWVFRALKLRHKPLVFDLQQAQYLDGAGLGMLALAQSRRSDLYILNAQGVVSTTLDICKSQVTIPRFVAHPKLFNPRNLCKMRAG